MGASTLSRKTDSRSAWLDDRARRLLLSRSLPLALVLGAFSLWLASLTQRSVWADELGTIDVLRRRDLPSLLAFVAEAERRPPLYFALLWSWTLVAGAPEFVMRYFSLWFATLSVPLTLALARSLDRLFGRAGLTPTFATVLLAFSPALALYAVMIRYYAFVLSLALALTLILVRWLLCTQQPRADAAQRLTLFSTIVLTSIVQRYEKLAGARLLRRRWAWLAAWLLVALLLIYSDYSVLALIAAQVLWLWLQRHAVRVWLAAWLALGLAYVPLIASLLDQVGRGKTTADLSGGAIGFALESLYPVYSFTFGETLLPWHPAFIVAAPFVALGFISALRALRQDAVPRFALWHMLLPLAFNVFILAAVATDLTFLTIASRTLFVLPLFLIWLSSGLAAVPARWRAPTVVMLALANVFALINLFAGQQYHNPIYAVPVREVAAMLARDSGRGDIIISDLDTAFVYYWDQQPAAALSRSSLAAHYLTTEPELSQAKARVASSEPPGVWLLIFGRDRSRANDHTTELETALTPRYRFMAEQDYARVDELYRLVKTQLIGREAYAYKLVVRLYELRP